MDEIKRIREISSRLLDPEFAIRMFETDWDAKVVVNEDAAIQFVNAQTELLFGYPRHELHDKHINMLLPEELHEKHLGHLKQYLEQPRVRPMGQGLELLARHRNGREFGVLIYLVPITWEQGLLVVATIRKK